MILIDKSIKLHFVFKPKRSACMYRSENISDLLSALVKTKLILSSPVRNKKAHNYKYAPLEEILRVVEEPLLENGLVISHDRDVEQNFLVTYLYHTSGQFISTKIRIEYKAESKLNFMQSLGSASTYAMRYNITALLNLAAEDDDDGVSSGDKKEYKKTAKEPVEPVVEQEETQESKERREIIAQAKEIALQHPKLKEELNKQFNGKPQKEYTYNDILILRTLLKKYLTEEVSLD